MKKETFRKYLNIKIHNATFKYLKGKTTSHSKSLKIEYESFRIQDYMRDSKFTTDEKILLFKLRTSMDDTKMNFSSMDSDVTCNLCLQDVLQDTSHLLYCQTLIKNCSELFNDCSVEYTDIFKGTKEQLSAVKLFHHVFKTKLSLTI